MVQTERKPVIDYFEGTTEVTKAYSNLPTGLHVINDTAAVSIVVTAAGFAMTLAPGKELNEDFRPFNSVAVEPVDGSSAIAFRAWVRG